MLRYLEALAERYFGNLNPAEVRVSVDPASSAKVSFLKFGDSTFETVVATNEFVEVTVPSGHSIKLYIGGRAFPFGASSAHGKWGRL